MPKDTVIVTTWPKVSFPNWEYTVLSQVQTLIGHFLLGKIDRNNFFAPDEKIKCYITHIKQNEDKYHKRKENMERLYRGKKKRRHCTLEVSITT